MPSTILSADDALSDTRNIDATSSGILWVCCFVPATNEARFFFSTDQGINWNESTSSKITSVQVTGVGSSFFIDKDDRAHLVYMELDNDFVYVRGTLSGNSWSWSTPLLIRAGASPEHPDLVAHREGNGWVAHVGYQVLDGSSFPHVHHAIIDIDAGGTPSLRSDTDIHAFAAVGGIDVSLDFHHEANDPKAVQGGTPHVYIAYQKTSGTGSVLFYRRQAYSAGSWSSGTERTIDAATQLIFNGVLSVHYDGTRIILVHARDATNTVIRVDERDEADTTTTNRDPTALADGFIRNMIGGSAANGDIWLAARGDTSSDIKKIRFNRGSLTWGSWITVEADGGFVGNYGISLMRMPSSVGVLGVMYHLESATPDQVRFVIATAAWQGDATLQGVATVSPAAVLSFAAEATLRGVATISPTANLGLNPSAQLQGVATISPFGTYVPALDFTVYDGYIVDPVNDSFIPLIYHDSPETPKRTGSIKLRPPRQDTGLEPTEVRPETGEVFSQQDFSHGAGQLYYHHEGRDVRKFLWSEGYELDIDTVGQPAILRHLHDVPTAAIASASIGQLEVFNDLPFAIDGTKVKAGNGSFPGIWTDEDPSGAEADVTVNRIVSSGEFLYAALGVDGIHRRDTSGAWTHWSDVQATRVAWLKNRIVASDGTKIYEVVSGGAAPTALETLPAGWTFEREFEAGGFIYAVAVNLTSSLSRIHTYGLNAAGSALEKKNETPFPRNQVIRSGRGYLGSVYLGGGIKTVGGGYDPVVYQAFPQDDGSLTYAKIAEGEGAGAQDLSVLEFEPIGEDVLFGWSLGSGFPYGSRDGLAVHKLKTGAFLSHLKKAGAGTGKQVVGIVSYKGRTLFSLKGDGVYFEDPNHFVADAFLISSVADWQTTARKSWDLFQISHSLHPAGSSVAADFTTKIPSEGAWTPLGLTEVATEEVHEVRIPETTGRLLALRVKSFATSDKTGAPEAIGFLVRSNLLPDKPEFGLQRVVRILDEDHKDGGEVVWPKGGVGVVRRSLHLLAHRWVTLHEPGVTWSVRVDDVQEVEPSGPIFRETEGEAPRQGYLIQLSLAGTRD